DVSQFQEQHDSAVKASGQRRNIVEDTLTNRPRLGGGDCILAFRKARRLRGGVQSARIGSQQPVRDPSQAAHITNRLPPLFKKEHLSWADVVEVSVWAKEVLSQASVIPYGIASAPMLAKVHG